MKSFNCEDPLRSTMSKRLRISTKMWTRCEYGSFALTAELDKDKFPLVQVDDFLNHSSTLHNYQDHTGWVEHSSNWTNITNQTQYNTSYRGHIYTMNFAETLLYPAHSSPKPVENVEVCEPQNAVRTSPPIVSSLLFSRFVSCAPAQAS